MCKFLGGKERREESCSVDVIGIPQQMCELIPVPISRWSMAVSRSTKLFTETKIWSSVECSSKLKHNPLTV